MDSFMSVLTRTPQYKTREKKERFKEIAPFSDFSTLAFPSLMNIQWE